MIERGNIRLFLASGHLSPEVLKVYASGMLNQELKDLASEHMSRCALCREATKGLILHGNPAELNNVITDLNLQVRARAREKQSNQGFRLSVPRGTRYAWISAAAILFIGLLFSFYFINLQPIKLRLSLAGHYDVIAVDRTIHPVLPLPIPLASHEEEMGLAPPPKAEPVISIIASEQDDAAMDAAEQKAIPDKGSIAEVNIISLDTRDNELGLAKVQVNEMKAITRDDDQVSGVGYIEGMQVETVATSRTKRSAAREQDVFTMVEQQPEFPGGMPALHAYLANNIKLPANFDSSLGKVIVRFTVDEKGKVRDPEIVQGVNETIDKEVLRVIRRMPNWTPGRQGGQAVKTRMILPVNLSPNRN